MYSRKKKSSFCHNWGLLWKTGIRWSNYCDMQK